MARQAAVALARELREAVAQRGAFTLVLAGGSTPERLYRELVADAGIDWSRGELFFGDERPVPPDHPESNFRMARTALLEPLGLDPSRIHRMQAERPDLDAAARDYERELARIAGGEPGGAPPRLDLALLGMGADGHTASLFPHTPALSESRSWVVANPVPQHATRRLTLTFPLIEASRCVFVLVCGHAKAQALAEVLEGAWDPDRLPIQRLRPRERVRWFVDAAAASRLRDPEGSEQDGCDADRRVRGAGRPGAEG